MPGISGLSPQAIARALGGKVTAGGQIEVTAPGHSKKDRSLSIRLDPTAPDGFVVNPFAGEDPIAMKDWIRYRLGLDPWQPGQKAETELGGLPAHGKFGPAHHEYWYRQADGGLVGVVCRWDFPNGKEILQLKPSVKGWAWKGLPAAGRPLYRLGRLLDNPTARVLVVEGEKCVEAAETVLTQNAVVTWAGGSAAWKSTDWSPLKDRDVTLWPDNDKAGRAAMNGIAAAIGGNRIRILDPADVPAKWDIADAIAGGWDRAHIAAWAKQHATAWKPPPPDPPDPPDNVVALRGEPLPPGGPNWRAQLMYNAEGNIKPKVSHNAFVLIHAHPDIAGCFAYNEIRREIGIVRALPWESPPPPRTLTDHDIAGTVRWLERAGLTPAPTTALAQIGSVSVLSSINPIRNYLERVRWDGVQRLRSFHIRYLGSPDEPIYGIFVMRWMVSAVARIIYPGCKADCMVVFEGAQGTLKSTMLRRLATIDGVEYFTDAVHDIESKDGAMQIARVWIAEIPEMHAFQSKEAEAIKSWLSRSNDQFRPPYGRMVNEYPRHTVIAGTLNPIAGYLTDPTGGRRFWPVPVGDRIAIAMIEADRDQLWAEAVALLKAGERWHLDEDEAKQADQIVAGRYHEDPWEDQVAEYVGRNQGALTIDGVIRYLGIPNAQKTRTTSLRVAALLRQMGYTARRSRATHSAAGSPGYVWSKEKT